MALLADDMVQSEGGTFMMGSDAFYPEEAPVHEAQVGSFELDRYAVTNRQFAEFVAATSYVTVAERRLDPADFPEAELPSLEPGSLVFRSTTGPVDLSDWRQWWAWVPGASWRHPLGPGNDIEDLEDHPVVQVAFEDARAFADWAGKRLPSEAEWEFAARGGLVSATYAWGEEANGAGTLHANTWQGRFPYLNIGANGWVGTAPVGSFEPNGLGLHEMTGNTWEWTSENWTDRHAQPQRCPCAPAGPILQSGGTGRRRVLKGGSHLCAPEYCLRYRPAARSPQSEDSASTHIGFRCAR